MTYKLTLPDPHGETYVTFLCNDPAYATAMAKDLCKELGWIYALTRLEVADGEL